MGEQGLAACSTRVAQAPCCGNRIRGAYCTNSAIAQQDLLAQISWLGSEFPLVHAEIGTEGKPSPGHFERTPAAQSAAIRTARNGFPIDPAAAHPSQRTHFFFLAERSMAWHRPPGAQEYGESRAHRRSGVSGAMYRKAASAKRCI